MSAVVYNFFEEKTRLEGEALKKDIRNPQQKQEKTTGSKKSLKEQKQDILKELRLSSLISSLTLKR